ncbi:MAG TPA: TetR/AcrR family transcriptional regulator, partial [bacterium]|nr:TetR/AcrR family transcriptional regulator [bacterium]
MGKPHSSNPRGRPKAFSEEEALDAAMKVFSDKGYEGASLFDLTRAMGINRTSLYATFGNKESLFRKALDQYTQGMRAFLDGCLKAPTALEGMTQLLTQGVEMFTDPEGPGACLIVRGPLTGTESNKGIQEYFTKKRSMLAQALQERFQKAKEAGELSPGVVPLDLARFYSVVMEGIALQA